MTKHLFSILLTYSTLTASAQSDTTHQLPETAVTYKADNKTPVTFLDMPSTELKTKYIGQEPSFLLAEKTSVTNYSDAGGNQGYSYIRLRGIDQTRINITLDGVPLNEPEDQGAYFSNYPDILNSLSKLQLQRGVGTTKNGIASFGGSIQLFSPDLYDTARTTLGVSYGSFNTSRVFGEYKSGQKGHKAIYARASEVYSDGYKYHSANKAQSAFISAGLFYDKTTWKLNLLAGHQQNQLAWLGVSDSLINIDRRTNANSNENDNFTQCMAQVQNSWQISRYSSMQSAVYYTFLRGNYDFDPNNFVGLPSTGELLNYAFRSNMTGVFSNYTFSKNHLSVTAGMHSNIYDRQHIGSDNIVGRLYKNTGYKNELSSFIKANYNVQRFSFFTDLQYRYSSFEYNGSVAMPELDWQFINPKAGISASIKDNIVAYYGIGKTGREPTRNDMFGGNDDLMVDSLDRPVLSIKDAEYVVDHELGLRHNSKNLYTSLNGYYMDFKNEIVLDGKFGPNGLALTDKVEKSFRTGIELTLAYHASTNLTFANNSSYNYSRITEQKQTFTPILTPPLIINQEVDWSYKKISATVSGRYQGSSFIDFANTTSIKSYFLLNARLGYDIHHFQFSLFINNILNTKYYSSGYVDFDGSNKYFVQAPINYTLSVKYTLR